MTSLVLAAGTHETVKGLLEISDGNFNLGAKELLFGMTAINLTGKCSSFNSEVQATFMKYALATGTLAICGKGTMRCLSGFKQKNIMQFLFGAFEAALGASLTSAVLNLDAKMIVKANEASLIAFTSVKVAKVGLMDLMKQHFVQGLSKLSVGIVGVIAACAYLFYSPIMSFFEKATSFSRPDFESQENLFNAPPVTKDQEAFIKTHENEIVSMYGNEAIIQNNSSLPPGWKVLGNGISKIALEHQDLPNTLIKVPVRLKADNLIKYPLVEDFQNFQKLKEASFDFSRIYIPNLTLYPIKAGYIEVAEKLDLVLFQSIPDSEEKSGVIEELNKFQSDTRLYDVGISKNHNAGFLNSSPLRIGIYDFDHIADMSDYERLMVKVGFVQGFVFKKNAPGFSYKYYKDLAVIALISAIFCFLSKTCQDENQKAIDLTSVILFLNAFSQIFP